MSQEGEAGSHGPQDRHRPRGEASPCAWPRRQKHRGGASHEHGPQLQEVVVLRALHLHDAPRVQAASDLLAFGFDQLIGSHHRERDAGLGDTG